MNILLLGNEKDILKQIPSDIHVKHIIQTPISDTSINANNYDIILINFKANNKPWEEELSELKRKMPHTPVLPSKDFLHDFDQKDEKFLKIKINRLIKYNVLPTDIFLQISNAKVIKIIKANELFSNDFIEKLSIQNYKWIYVKEKNFKELTDFLYQNIESTFKSKVENKSNKTFPIDIEKNMAAQDLIQNLKIDPFISKNIQEIAQSSLSLISNNSALKTLLEKYSKNGEYLINHSLMTSHICCLIAQIMSWSTDSTLTRLSIAAFLHDVTFKDEALAKVDSLSLAKEKHKENFTEIQMHPVHISRMIANLQDIPPGIDKIILTHHETPDGSGFPRSLNGQAISQLEAVFIMAHDFVDKVYNHNITDSLIKDISTDFEKKYNIDNFKTPLLAFKNIFQTVLHNKEEN